MLWFYSRIIFDLVVFIVFKSSLVIYFGILNEYIIIGLYIHQILFAMVYCLLRCRFDPSFDFFKVLFALLVGPDTLKYIESESETKQQM